MSELNASETPQHLKDLVERHTVVYEVRPHEEVVMRRDGVTRVKVGFDLELCGTHDHGHTRLTPGCDQCNQTFRDLREIADWIMPKAERPSIYQIESFDRALHEARKRHRFEVALNLRILHRHGWDRPIDKCEERCLRDMEARLDQLGVKRG